ncbi:MAG: prepilin peptidase [Chloroflexi bacterium]|nr:prepilin peptidase [Chloroflexota bacterium]
MATALVAAAFAACGLCVGSFLNLCIDRLPEDQSIVRPPSHCPACGRRVSPLDLVPLFNYLWLRGRCRYCSAHIPRRVPIVELLTGLAFALLYWKFGISRELGMAIVYASFMMVIFFIDLEKQLILNKVVYPGMVVALAFSFFWPDLGVVSALEGGAIGLAMILLPYLIYPKGMGLGDVRLAAMIGLMTGVRGVLVGLILAMVGGGLVAILLLVLRLKKRSDAIPFGTFLAVGAMVALLWGHTIADWYVGLFP